MTVVFPKNKQMTLDNTKMAQNIKDKPFKTFSVANLLVDNICAIIV